jgi:urease accessory protein UreF
VDFEFGLEKEFQALNVLGLVQLIESVPTAGGYSDCFQIPSLVRGGYLRDSDQVLHLLNLALQESIGPAEGVVAGAAFRAARRCELGQLSRLSSALSNHQLPAEIRTASLQMGTHLWELSRRWEWAQSIHGQINPLADEGGIHNAIAFGILVSETTAQQVRAIAMCLFRAARTIISSAVQAIPLDEKDGNRLLSTLGPMISELARNYADRPLDRIMALRPAMVLQAAMSGTMYPQ